MFDALMLALFFIAWPVKLNKALQNFKAGHGPDMKEFCFLSFVLLGYLIGTTGKMLNNAPAWVLGVFLVNTITVGSTWIILVLTAAAMKKRELMANTEISLALNEQ